MTSQLQALGPAACAAVPCGQAFRLTVSGRSMAPVLMPGDEIVAERISDAREAGLGDLVVVDLPGAGLVVHRLLWRGRESVRTRGDATGRMDPPVARERVMGRVVEATRAGRAMLPGTWSRRATWAIHFAAAAAYRLRRRFQAMQTA